MGIGSFVGAAIGGVGNYFAAKSAQKQANKNQRRAEQHELNILKNQVGWRVDDAVRAGLHPLAALGLNPASSSAGPAQAFAADYSQMGADLGRAIDSIADPKDKIASAATQLMFEKTALENEYTKTQVASQRMRNMQMAAPGVPGGETDPSKIRIPFTNHDLPIVNPGLADKAQSSFGEGGEFIFGMGNLLESGAMDAYKYLELENVLTTGSHEQMMKNLNAAKNYLIDSNTRGPQPGDFN